MTSTQVPATPATASTDKEVEMLAALTGMGLSAAAGLNAYIPFMIVALMARFTDVITLPEGFSWIESPWAIGVGAVLLLTEVVLDKIPAIDTVNDTIQTFIRPSMGGLIFAATNAADNLDQSAFMKDNPWIGVVLGIVVSGLVHTGKMAARPAINAGTLGAGAPVVSTAEDAGSIGLSLVAIFIPILVIVALIALAWLLVWMWLKVRRWRKRRDAHYGERTAYRTP
ncbi:uncharacterized protein DUF4126 [Knoellia remsis]|uniref:Uncharacterized protein DUF4126 n=2 Tax=Knoellia remsis TaxID=407159 RepID=A0A2T0UJH4_9MICO|nr:uncharacterized protein DUF4126 [Knoellia remsis]